MTDACCAPDARRADLSSTAARDPRSATSATSATSGTPPASLVDLPGGRFAMGDESPWAYPGDGEGPVHDVHLAPYAIDAFAVTNARFAAFVDATGHVTDAERFGWSFVFGGLLPD